MSYTIQLKISIAGIKPTIWRRVIISSELSLQQTSLVINTVMPWDGGDMHQFIVKDVRYIAPFPGGDDEDDPEEIERYNTTKIGDLLKREQDFIKYEYDFGDSWIHNISVEKIFEPIPERKAIFVTGKNMAPPEGCGGVEGYNELLKVLELPSHPRYKEICDWLQLEEDEVFDPTYMGADIDEIDSELYDIIEG